jgi:hypothetical protein
MYPLNNSIKMILKLESGSCIAGQVGESPGGPSQTVFYLRTGSWVVAKLQQAPEINVQIALVGEGKAHPAIVMFHIRSVGVDLFFNCWINCFVNNSEHNGDAFQMLSNLANQDKIVIYSVGDDRSKDLPSVTIDNRYRDKFSQIFQIMESQFPWTTEDFETTKQQLWAKYPNNEMLWRSLNNARQIKGVPFISGLSEKESTKDGPIYFPSVPKKTIGYTSVPNDFLTALYRFQLSENQRKLLLFLELHSHGCGKAYTSMRWLKDFVAGSLPPEHMGELLRLCKEQNIIIIKRKNYYINYDVSTWKVPQNPTYSKVAADKVQRVNMKSK